MELAKQIGAFVISITSNSGSEMSKIAHIAIEVVTGAEVITGSTRMKAGSAQKMVLNMLSTVSMIKIGKVYGNLMVDLKPTNLKLLERAKRIVSLATNISKDEAEKYLNETDYDVKLDKESAKNLLEKNEGYISKALQNV